MGLLDRFRGGGRQNEVDGNEKAQIAEDVSASSSAMGGGGFVSPSSPSSSSSLDFSSGDGGFKASEVLGGPRSDARMYNPYEGLGMALDRRDVKGPFRLPKEPEFLFKEEATVHQRSWSENLTYYTGSGYLIGAIAGGGAGAYRAISAPVSLTPAGLPSQRLRINQLLNTSGKLGRSAGNSLGVVGLFFASSESFLRNANDGLLPDETATVGAGALTGALYRSVRGPRQAAAAAAVGMIGGSLILAGRAFVNPGL